MAKSCPKCGKDLPDDAKFCMDCGYTIDSPDSTKSSIFSNGTIFIVIIVVILVIGGIFIASMGFGGNDTSKTQDVQESVVDMTITDVLGYDSSYDSKKSYTLYTEAIFNKVPNDLKGYNVKTTYYDANDTEIGHETETLDNIYYDSQYSLSFGHYTSYKKPNPDHVTVEILKGSKVVDTYTEKIDKNKIDYLN